MSWCDAWSEHIFVCSSHTACLYCRKAFWPSSSSSCCAFPCSTHLLSIPCSTAFLSTASMLARKDMHLPTFKHKRHLLPPDLLSPVSPTVDASWGIGSLHAVELIPNALAAAPDDRAAVKKQHDVNMQQPAAKSVDSSTRSSQPSGSQHRRQLCQDSSYNATSLDECWHHNHLWMWNCRCKCRASGDASNAYDEYSSDFGARTCGSLSPLQDSSGGSPVQVARPSTQAHTHDDILSKRCAFSTSPS